MGEFRVPWNNGKAKAIYDQFLLTDPSKIAELTPIEGRVAIQAFFEGHSNALDAIDRPKTPSEEELPPVYIGDLRVNVTETRMFEQDIRHKLRFSVEGSEFEVTATQENTKTPKWTEKFTFKVMKSPQKDAKDLNML